VNEAKGVAFTDVYTVEGDKLSLVVRSDESIQDATDTLMAEVARVKRYKFFMKQDGIGQIPVAIARPQQPIFNTIPPPHLEQVPDSGPPPPSAEIPRADFDAPFPFDLPEEQVEVQMGKDWGLVKYKPKATELKPGDRYEVKVNGYKYNAKEIQFWDGGQFPVLTHNMDNDTAIGIFNEIFQGWTPHKDDVLHDMLELILTVQCTQKLTPQKNPYQNLAAARRA
jgi:hypothetical protein